MEQTACRDDAVGKTTTGGASWLLPCRRCIPWRMCLGSSGSYGAWRGRPGSTAERLHAAPEQPPTVAPGWRWRQNPAAISPGGLEQPARSAACAMLTGLGVLVSRVLQRQGRLSLRTHAQQSPGTQGTPAPPTAVVLAMVAPVARLRGGRGAPEVEPLSGVHPSHRRLCEALGLDSSW